MIHQPQLLFLDEPTAGVDAASPVLGLDPCADEQGVTVFVTTHYLDEAKHANRVSMLSSGRIAGQGTPAELKVRYWRGCLLTIVRDEPQRARVLLEEVPGVSDVSPYGSTVGVVSQTSETAAIRATLELAGVQVASTGLVAPGLEDVFPHLVGAPSL